MGGGVNISFFFLDILTFFIDRSEGPGQQLGGANMDNQGFRKVVHLLTSLLSIRDRSGSHRKGGREGPMANVMPIALKSVSNTKVPTNSET